MTFVLRKSQTPFSGHVVCVCVCMCVCVGQVVVVLGAIVHYWRWLTQKGHHHVDDGPQREGFVTPLEFIPSKEENETHRPCETSAYKS